MTKNGTWLLFLSALAAYLPLNAAAAATGPAETFRDAYYLETHEHDLAGAIAAYDRVLAAGDAPAALLDETRQRLARCREDLRAADLAALMPPEAIAYLEFTRPGEHLERVIEMLGLHAAAADMDTAGTGAGPDRFAFPGEPALVIPRRIVISDAIIRQIKAFHGAAAALTDINLEKHHPEGVLILHPGDVDLLRGMVETAVQFVRPTDPIQGFHTIEIPEPQCPIIITFTNRLVVVGTQRALIEGVIARLSQADRPSLAGVAVFQEQAAIRDRALAFAFVNAQEGLQRLQRIAQHDHDVMQGLAIGQAFFDLAHLTAFSLALGTDDDGLAADFVMAMSENQSSIVYNLLRTPPMRGEALASVPTGAAGILAIGINPTNSLDEAVRVSQKAQAMQMVTGLDLGRELFANIREVAVYVMPPQEHSPPGRRRRPPDAALVTVVGDPDKSTALWDFLLSLPGRVQGHEMPAAVVTTIDGTEVRAYPLSNGMQVHLAQSGANILIGTTPEVMAASLSARAQGNGVLSDPALKSATERIGPHTSIAAIGHIGRIARVASAYAPSRDAVAFNLVSQAASEATATIIVDEAPARLHINAKLANLPRIDQIMETLAQAGVLQAQHVQVTRIDAEAPVVSVE